eukprot:130662-Rhodomonas_salina.2
MPGVGVAHGCVCLSIRYRLPERQKAALAFTKGFKCIDGAWITGAQIGVLEERIADLESERSKSISAIDFEKGEHARTREELKASSLIRLEKQPHEITDAAVWRSQVLAEQGQRKRAMIGEREKEVEGIRVAFSVPPTSSL